MIETKVPKDVRSYKTKVIGPFTTRQLLCFGAAILLDVSIFLFIHITGFNMSMTTAFYGLVFIDLPILAFMIEPQGMPMEKYLKNIILPGLMRPNKRKAENLLYEQQKMRELTKKEKEERLKKIKHIGQKNPELKPYL